MLNLNASARIIRDEALKKGYKVQQFEDKHLLKIWNKARWAYFRGSRHSLQSSVGMTIANYKGLTRQVLENAGLPMARGALCFTFEAGKKMADEKGLWPVVYKPAKGAHGTGVVVGIKDDQELKKTVKEDKNSKHGFILEEKLAGKDFRIVVINYRFFCATLRVPAFVDGDGKKSIRELIKKENKKPERGVGHAGNLTKIRVDNVVREYLREQGLRLGIVPKKGERIMLRKTANLSTGGVGIDVTDMVGKENKELFERVAIECDLNTVGIDVMAVNLTQPLKEQDKAGILEVNASPGLRMHHFPYEGKPRNVAGAILEMVLGN
jgi:cyanophycin synthetase